MSEQLKIKTIKDKTVPRTYDVDGYKRRAACLCFRDQTEEEILLVSSPRKVDKWIVAGGGIDPGEEPRIAAERESLEEAGATGTLGRLVGIFDGDKDDGFAWWMQRLPCSGTTLFRPTTLTLVSVSKSLHSIQSRSHIIGRISRRERFTR